MTSLRSQDVSLYELALSSEQPPHPLQISPTTFKSMLANLLDILVDQHIAATLWLKLPKGNVWQAELDRFRKLASAPYSLYLLHTYREDNGDAGESALAEGAIAGGEADAKAPDDLDLVADQGLLPDLETNSCRSLSITLSPESLLRREYFLLVFAPTFRNLVLAHRPRTVRPGRENDPGLPPPLPTVASAAGEEDLERKHPLLGVCSFEMETLQRILEGIHQAVAQAQPSAEVSEVLAGWNTLTTQLQAAQLSPSLLGHLITRQVQQQEDIWHGSILYRKQSEKVSTLQLENEELFNSIRLKDEFLKNVGQELRTPLATMKTALTLLNSPNLKPPQRQRYMDMLTHECDRQSSLITSVLDLIQLENAADQALAQPLRLSDVVPGVVSTYQPLAQEKGVMLAYTIPEELPAVSCASSWLRQIVINLLHNGIKFTPQGGQVWVKAKQQGEYVQLEFRDTGIGIPAAEIPKIFDRFYRVRSGNTGEEVSGAGLGLSIVQQLLLRCGGSISVKSRPNEGATFTVLLPTYHEPSS